MNAELLQHEKKMEELDAEIELARQDVADSRAREDRTNALLQKRQDLIAANQAAGQSFQARPEGSNATDAMSTLQRTEAASQSVNETDSRLDTTREPTARLEVTPPMSQTSNPDGFSNEISNDASPSKLEWQRQKEVEQAHNEAMDSIMDLVGLEGVKEQVLDIKAKIETLQRQGGDMSRERFHISFLGNPGTGKSHFNILRACDCQSADFNYRQNHRCPTLRQALVLAWGLAGR